MAMMMMMMTVEVYTFFFLLNTSPLSRFQCLITLYHLLKLEPPSKKYARKNAWFWCWDDLRYFNIFLAASRSVREMIVGMKSATDTWNTCFNFGYESGFMAKHPNYSQWTQNRTTYYKFSEREQTDFAPYVIEFHNLQVLWKSAQFGFSKKMSISFRWINVSVEIDS